MLRWAILCSTALFVVLIVSVFLFNQEFIEQHKKSQLKYLRVVSLAPSFSETMERLHQSHRLVGVTTHCQIKGADSLPKVGSFAQVNLEAVLSLKPDLVLAVPHVLVAPVLNRIRENGIEVYTQQPDTISDIILITRELSQKFKVPERGKKVVEKINTTIERAKEISLEMQEELENNRFLVAVSLSPLVVASVTSFPSEILERIGFKNIITKKVPAWPVLSIEELVSEPPGLLIFTSNQTKKDHVRSILARIDRNPLIISPPKSIFSSPSPKIIDDIKDFMKLLKQAKSHVI